MKLDVPFHLQSGNDCGPVSLQMVLEYLGESFDIEKIKAMVGSETSGYTWTVGLAKTAVELGFKAEFYSTSLDVNPENFNLELYKKQTAGVDAAKVLLHKLITAAKQNGVIMEEKSLKLDGLLSKITKNKVPIVLLDSGIIKGKEGYQGHFVPVVGYDGKNVFVHQAGPPSPNSFMPIPYALFDRARKAKGTDEDVVFISRKS